MRSAGAEVAVTEKEGSEFGEREARSVNRPVAANIAIWITNHYISVLVEAVSSKRDVVWREEVKIYTPNQAVKATAKIGNTDACLKSQFAFEGNVVLLNPWRL
jgi:hypothetical protein